MNLSTNWARLKTLGCPGLLTLLVGTLVACGGSGSGSKADPKDPIGPVISTIFMVGAPIYPGSQIQILVSAYSTDNAASLSYAWEVPAGWSGDSDTNLLVLTAPDEQAAQGTVTVEVSDGARSITGRILVSTRGPAIESFSVAPLPLKDEATFMVVAYNLDGTVMRTHYDIGGMRLEDRGSLWTWTVPDVMPMGGLYRLQATVEDSNGLSATASVDAYLPGVSAWSAFGGNRQRTGQSSSPDAHGAGDVLWTYDADGWFESSPALGADGTVYVGSSNRHVYALAPEDGSVKWVYQTGGAVHSSPAVSADGTIYVGSLDHKVYALNPDGSMRWAYETYGEVHSSPALGVDGTVYVGSNDDHVYALNPDGTYKWAYKTGGDVRSSAGLGADGTVYIGSNDEHVYALNPDGSLKWVRKTGGFGRTSPAVGADGTVYVGSLHSRVYALNPEDGSVKWAYSTGQQVYSSPAVGADGSVYVGSNDRKVHALNPDGSRKWTYETGSWILSSPAVGADGSVYVGSNDRKVYALNPDGSLKWAHLGSWGIDSSPALGADGTVYVGSGRRMVYAIR